MMSLGDSPIVQTKDGKLQGFVSKANDDLAKPIFNYLNIPFGKPPTGKRRFMPPEKWVDLKSRIRTDSVGYCRCISWDAFKAMILYNCLANGDNLIMFVGRKFADRSNCSGFSRDLPFSVI